ncbi:hypothetical protein L6R52_34840 [Myxococcota bacterium]|nr:hypothetical protein [Myxococcota bacterium]
MSALADKKNELVRRRAIDVAGTVSTWVGTGQVLLAAFALGASFGPAPLRPIELVVAVLGVLLVTLLASVPFAKRRLERAAKYVYAVEEGRHARRIFVYDDYVMIGPELVPFLALTSVEREGKVLVVRYRDPDHDGLVLRELAGPRETLDPLAAHLHPPPSLPNPPADL